MGNRPRLDRPPVELPPQAGALAVVWDALAALSTAAENLPWTLVGGQMVLLHGLECGQTPHRVSTDIDTAVDVRADRGALKRLTSLLGDLDFEPAGISPDGRAHRFTRPIRPASHAVIDVLIDAEQPDTGDDLVIDVLVPGGTQRQDQHTHGRHGNRVPCSRRDPGPRKDGTRPSDHRRFRFLDPETESAGGTRCQGRRC